MHSPKAAPRQRWSHHGLMAVVVLLCAVAATPRAVAQLPAIGGLPIGGTVPSSTSGSSGGAFSANTADTTLHGDTTLTTGLQQNKETPDSVLRTRVYRFHYAPASVKIDQWSNPTLAPDGVHRADALDALDGDYRLGKGMLGHPHRSLFPHTAEGLQASLQPDPNEGYAKRMNNIWLYQTQTPYTRLSYNSSLDKDYAVSVAHTQNFRPGWNAAFDYHLLRPVGTYTSSAAQNHYLDATTNYFSADARLQATGGIIWQSFRIDENGGIADDAYFTERRVSNEAGMPVNLYNMGTRHKELTAFGRATYSLVRQTDGLRHRDSIATDTIDVVDTLRAPQPRALNAGAIGIEANIDRRKRTFVDSTWWREMSATLFWTNDIYPDHRWRNPAKLTLGLQPRLVQAAVEADTMRLGSWLDPFAKAEIAIDEATIAAEAEARGNFSPSGIPDTRLAVAMNLPAGKLSTTISAVWQRKMPDVRMLHDASLHQDHTLAAIATERYGAHLAAHGTVDFDIDLRMSHLSHNVWYDTLRLVHEGTSPLWLYQASLVSHIAVGWLRIDLQQLLQHSTDQTQMPVPLWASKNSIYTDLYLFDRAVRMQIGIDLRYHTPFYAPTYDPYTGLFMHQDEQEVGGYLWADVFVDINVKRASFYAKAGHLNAMWNSAPDYFILPHYPGAGFGFYWGITWHFFD